MFRWIKRNVACRGAGCPGRERRSDALMTGVSLEAEGRLRGLCNWRRVRGGWLRSGDSRVVLRQPFKQTSFGVCRGRERENLPVRACARP
jgi:hypothetical protein